MEVANLENNPTSSAKNRKRFSCKICSVTCNYKSHLKKHIRIVHDRIRVNCDFCNETFSNPANVKRHILTVHQGERPSKCKISLKSYTSQTHLNEHMKTIHDKVRYFCKICCEPFAVKNYFKKHIETVHKGVKAFSCKFCDKSYSVSNNLKNHINVHHSKNKIKYKSNQCSVTNFLRAE